MRWSRIPAWDQSDSELDFFLNSLDKFINLCSDTQSKTTGVKLLFVLTRKRALLHKCERRLALICLSKTIMGHGRILGKKHSTTVWETSNKHENGANGYRLLQVTHQAFAVPCMWVLHNTYNKHSLSGGVNSQIMKCIFTWCRSDPHLCDHSTANTWTELL